MNNLSPHVFMSLVEQTANAIFVLRVQDQEFLMEYVNDAYLYKFRLLAENLVGKNLKDILVPEKYAQVQERFLTCVNSRSAISYEETIVLEEGVLTCLSEAFPVLDSLGQVTHVIGLSRDITELKRQRDLLTESENTLRAIINSSDNVTLVIDPDQRIIYANTAAQQHAVKMFGRKYLIGDSILNYLTEEQKNIATVHFEAILKKKRRTLAFEHQFTYPSGEEAWYIRRYYPATDSNGNYIGIVVNSTNITARKQQELQIEKHTNALREIAQIQSHVIRRPVANIIGLTDLIDLERPPAETAEVVAHLRKSTLELDELVRQIISKTHDPNS